MDQELYDFLVKLGFADEDIILLRMDCPGLDIISADRAFQNIKTVVRCGYPQEDLVGLIAANPSFLLNNPQDTQRILLALGDDVEAKLKADPQLI